MAGVGHPAWNLLTGTLTGYVLLGITIVLGIFLMPFTMSHLGQSNYGLWMLVASMTAYFQLLDLGYGNGLVRQITQADAQGDENGVNEVLSTFLVVYGALGLVALAATALLALTVLPRFPNLSPEQIPTAQWVLGILGFRMAIGFPMGIFGAVTTARQRFALTGSVAIAVALLQAAATFLILRAGYGLVPLVAATTSLNVLSYVAYAAVARQTFPGMRLSPSLFSRRQVREVTAFSFYLFLISIAIHVGTSVDNLIIGAFAGTSAIAVYTVALRLAEYQRQLCGQFSGFLFPLMVRFDASGDGEAMRATLVDGTRLALGLVSGVTVCLLAFGGDIVTFWMGPGFSGSIVPLYLLALAGVIVVAQGPAGNSLLATGRHRLVAGVSILNILLNIVLSLALVSRYGLTGVAFGTTIPYIVLNAGIVMPVAARAVNIPVFAFFASVLTPSLMAAVPAAAVAVLIRTMTTPGSFLTVVAQAAVVGILFVAAFCMVGLRGRDRARYFAAVRQATVALRRPGVVTP